MPDVACAVITADSPRQMEIDEGATTLGTGRGVRSTESTSSQSPLMAVT